MNLSVGNIMYLSLVVASFGFFIGVLGITSWRCNRAGAKARESEPLQLQGAALKIHGDKFSHSMDAAA